MTFAEFFGKGGKYTPAVHAAAGLFRRDWSSQWSNGPGAFAIMYYPLPFNKRLKITAYHPGGMKQYEMTWFQYTYLKYPPGTPVETWKGRGVDSPAVRTQFEQMGKDPEAAGRRQDPQEHALAGPGRNEDRVGSLRPRRDHVVASSTVEPWSADTFFHTRIRITWDDQPTPAVDMSIASFFGGGGDTIGVEDVSGKTLGDAALRLRRQDGRCYSYWPMPYWSRAHIEIVNDGKDGDFAIGDRGDFGAASVRSTIDAARPAISAPSARSTFRRTAHSTRARFRPAAAARSSA